MTKEASEVIYAEDVAKPNVFVQFKKLDEKAVIPTYANIGDVGADLTATSVKHVPVTIEEAAYYEYGTGLAMKIPEGYGGFIFPRSSVSKKDLFLANAVGVIDPAYTGEIKLRFKYKTAPKLYEVGERIGQLVILPIPTINFSEVAELPITQRGNNGFGSSGA
jgi:dUTP pyrophosphatase